MSDNQHRRITGYRELSDKEIDLMNDIKRIGETARELIAKLQKTNNLDHRWIAIGQTNLQQGFMALVRSVAKPESF